MLKHFHYLDETQLSQYISQVEDGLRQVSNRGDKKSRSRRGGLGGKVLTASGENSTERSDAAEFQDTPAARFERLLRLIDGNEEDFHWIEVLQPVDLEAARPGAIVDVSCEAYQPEIVKLMGRGGLLESLPQLQAAADLVGGGLPGLPDSGQLSALANLSSTMPNGIIVGEVTDTDWRVVAKLTSDEDLSDIEGDVRIVGKVKKIWSQGAWRPLPGLPLVSQMPREQRRQYERNGPSTEDEKRMWIEGPAIELDVLAIYS